MFLKNKCLINKVRLYVNYVWAHFAQNRLQSYSLLIDYANLATAFLRCRDKFFIKRQPAMQRVGARQGI